MNPTETKTKEYFDSYEIFIEKIPESNNKTPDFEGQEILVEVKEVKPEEKEGLNPDSTYNAIKNNLKDAARKFREYDPEYKKKHIVVIFSEDIIREDIYSVWTGNWSPDEPAKIFKGGMLLSSDHKEHIDAIAWFKKASDRIPAFVWAMNNDIKKYFPSILN